MKWYSVNLNGRTVNDLERAERFQEFLYDTVDTIEVSGNFDDIHFEIWANDNQKDEINRWLATN